MVREALVALLLMFGLTHTAIPHRKRAIGLWSAPYTRSKDVSRLPWQSDDDVSLHIPSSFWELRKDIDRLVRMRESDSIKRTNSLSRRLLMMHTIMAPRMIQKRYNCDTTRITIQTILEYLRSGRICGVRVTTVRFGLGGRR